MRRLAVVAMVAAAACGGHRVMLARTAPATFEREPPGHEAGRVARVVDGDTIEVTIVRRVAGPGAGAGRVGATYDVRLLGIDAPESVSPRTGVECFGREAASAARALLSGATVRLVRDVEEADAYERLLRYVYLGSEMVNARLVANGYATAAPHAPNLRHADLLRRLEDSARAAGSGAWSGCA